MTKLTIAFVAALSLTTFGCKKGGSDALAKMEAFEKSMCECKDKACADKVHADMATWGTEMAKTARKEEKPDPELAKKSGDIMTKYTACMTKLMTAGVGGDAAKPPEAKTEPSAPVASGSCPDGSTNQAKGGFCIKLPAGTKGDGGPGTVQGNGKVTRYGWAGGEKGSDWGISVDVKPMSEYWADNKERVKSPPHQGKLGKEGKVGDEGAWASGEDGPPSPGYAQRNWIKSVTKNEKLQLECSITRASGAGAPSEDEVFEACKSIAFAK